LNCYDGGQHGEQYGDRAWVLEQIDKLPINMQSDIKKRYSEIYTNLDGDLKQRYRSNRWLLAVVKKYKPKLDEGDLLF